MRPPARPRWAAALIAAVTALVLTACGGSSASNAGSPGSTGPRLTVVPAAVPVDASAGCTATPVVPPGQSKVPFTSGTDTAFYLRNVPPAPVAPTPAPLVMDLHGWSSTADIQVQTTGFETLGDTKGFVTITPESANAERVFDATLGGTALTYLGAVLDDAERTLCIDQNRVFVAGYSQGAIVTSSMACQFADRVAAVATVAGITIPDGCAPARPVPVIAFHGTEDPFVGYDGYVGAKTLDLKAPDGSGRTLRQLGVDTTTKMGPAVPDTAAAWAARNGCDAAPPTETPLPPDVTKLTFTCPAGDDVVLYRVNAGGHSWPDSAFTKAIATIVGPTTSTINATDLAWQFFQDHPKEN